MKTYCVRQGQVEVGVIEHEGREFAALGATVVGGQITGYTRNGGGNISLRTWCGHTMLDCRHEVVERFWSGSLALLFRLPRGRFIVGYALGDDGVLFRGELFTDPDENEARRVARRISDHFAEIDADDEATFAAEAEQERLVNIKYSCPACGHEWQEQWTCACDSECPGCGTRDINALSWKDAK